MRVPSSLRNEQSRIVHGVVASRSSGLIETFHRRYGRTLPIDEEIDLHSSLISVQRHEGRVVVRALIVSFVLGIAVVSVGCGSSSDETAEEMRINRAVADAEKSAKQEREIEALKERLDNQDKRPDPGTIPAPVDSPAPARSPSAAGSGGVQSFHTRNVSCELSPLGATCTVSSTGEDFILTTGSSARIQRGPSFPKGHGTRSDWGATWQAGAVTCSVPRSDQPNGIICTDGAGHGFEASAVGSRKKAY